MNFLVRFFRGSNRIFFFFGRPGRWPGKFFGLGSPLFFSSISTLSRQRKVVPAGVVGKETRNAEKKRKRIFTLLLKRQKKAQK